MIVNLVYDRSLCEVSRAGGPEMHSEQQLWDEIKRVLWQEGWKAIKVPKGQPKDAHYFEGGALRIRLWDHMLFYGIPSHERYNQEGVLYLSKTTVPLQS